jgi:hypothetical protein
MARSGSVLILAVAMRAQLTAAQVPVDISQVPETNACPDPFVDDWVAIRIGLAQFAPPRAAQSGAGLSGSGGQVVQLDSPPGKANEDWLVVAGNPGGTLSQVHCDSCHRSQRL